MLSHHAGTRQFMLLCLALGIALAPYSRAEAADNECRAYSDSHGRIVKLHAKAFADRVVCARPSHCRGGSLESDRNSQALAATGQPNFRKPGASRTARGLKPRGTFSLGCKGSAIWEFIDNRIIDIEGPDVYVFERGGAVEPTSIEVSNDLVNWSAIVPIRGGVAGVDLSEVFGGEESFRYIRLTDLGENCSGKTAGADIDAIATMAYAWIDIEDSSETVLFEFGEAALTEAAARALDARFADYSRLGPHRLKIMGHTDDVGTTEFNRSLSLRRASAVAEYAERKGFVRAGSVAVLGEGEYRPIASNATKRGRAMNRRVELMITSDPPASCTQISDEGGAPKTD